MSTNQDSTKGFGINGPSQKWFQGFVRRNPKFSFRVADNISKATACVTEASVKWWVTSVVAKLEADGLSDVLFDPTKIYNADETAFVFDPKKGLVLAPIGTKRVHNITEREKEQISVMLTLCADGNLMTPYVIYPGQRLHASISQRLTDMATNINYTITQSGWETAESMLKYVECFDAELVKKSVQKPVVMFLDGHSSHDNFLVIFLATCRLLYR